MINSISISNFKSIQGTGELKIAPLTFFIGPNSSGKSSILKSLLVAHQTAISDDTEVNPFKLDQIRPLIVYSETLS